MSGHVLCKKKKLLGAVVISGVLVLKFSQKIRVRLFPGSMYVFSLSSCFRIIVFCFLSRYSKTEGLIEGSPEMLVFSHLLTEPPCNRMKRSHLLLGEVEGFDRMALDLKHFPFVFPVMSTKICILERWNWRKTNAKMTWCFHLQMQLLIKVHKRRRQSDSNRN